MARLQKQITEHSSKSSRKVTISKPPKITIRKRKMWVYEKVKSMPRIPNMLEHMKKTSSTGYYRKTMMGVELVWGLGKFKAASDEGLKNRKYMVIFSMVAKNARSYAAKHKIKPLKYQPSEKWNTDINIDKIKIIGTDINSAYWQIAYQLGIIKETTFIKGETDIENKALLLASLATLGSDKTYQVIKNGELVNEYVTLKGDDQLKEIYKKIRYTCFGYMKEMVKLLGPDFVGYRTDCIYYKHTAANVKKIRRYLESKELSYKMLREQKSIKKQIK